MARHLFLQGSATPPVVINRPAQVRDESFEPTRTYYVHPDDPDVLIEATRDGDDFIKLCPRHQWASVPTPGYAPACPHCLCEYDERRGRRRYHELHSSRVRIVIGRG